MDGRADTSLEIATVVQGFVSFPVGMAIKTARWVRIQEFKMTRRIRVGKPQAAWTITF